MPGFEDWVKVRVVHELAFRPAGATKPTFRKSNSHVIWIATSNRQGKGPRTERAEIALAPRGDAPERAGYVDSGPPQDE